MPFTSTPPLRLIPAAASLLILAGLTGCQPKHTNAPDYSADDASVLDRSEIYHQATTMQDLLTGRLAGVDVFRTGGRLAVRIRGIGTINSSSEALIVVDGVQSSGYALASMNPDDVATVRVIKDGAAAAYGLRGANGVLVVTTRRADPPAQ